MSEQMPEAVAAVTPEEHKIVDYKVVDGNIEITLDTDKDGEPSVIVKVVGKEILGEALAKIKDLF